MATVDYAATIQRILDILQENTQLDSMVKEWRFGELPEQTQAHNWPCIYVTTSGRPQVSREPYTVSRADVDTGLRAASRYKVISEYWIIIVTAPAQTPAAAQKQMLNLQKRITDILTNNILLQLPTLADATTDINEKRLTPYATYSEINSQDRLTMAQGKLVQSMSIMLRAHTIE